MTEGFLGRMVAATRQAIDTPEFRGRPPAGESYEPTSLRAALERERPRGGVMVEYKRRSPGAVPPDLTARSPTDFVAALAGADVTAYSAVAAIPEFGGGPEDVAAVARASGRPVLFKDFVISPLQLAAARRAGAAAVLLIARLETLGLLEVPLRALADEAHRLGLEVVLEWHDAAEVTRTEDVPADVFGVNVRDLDTLALDRSTAAETMRAADGHRPLVGMSAVDGPEAARWFWNLGADAILVGTAVARSPEPARFVESLRRVRGGGSA